MKLNSTYQMVQFALALALFFFIASCAGLRHIPEDDSLYTGIRMKIRKDKSFTKFNIKQGMTKKGDAYMTVWDVPNGGFFGTPFLRVPSFRLSVYNAFRTEKEKGFRVWVQNNFGEPPILLSEIQPKLKCEKLEETYENFGHFGTTASYKLRTKSKGKKSRIKYKITVTPAFTYQSINIDSTSFNAEVSALIMDYRIENSLLKVGDDFNMKKLRAEKSNIWEHLQNSGYFYLEEKDIEFYADTTSGNRKVDLTIRINPSLSSLMIKKVTVNKITLNVDSIHFMLDDVDPILYDKGFLRLHFVNKLVTIDSNKIYSRQNTFNTSQRIAQTGIFDSYKIRYTPLVNDSTMLDANIQLNANKTSRFGFGINANYKSIGYIGPSFETKFSQLNILGKGHKWVTTLNGYYDFPIGRNSRNISDAFGFNLNTRYTYLVFPKKQSNKTTLPSFFVNGNIQFTDRINLFQQVSTELSYGFDWQPNKRISHEVKIFNINLFDVLNTTPRLDSIVAVNSLVKTSLDNQITISSGYSFKYDRRINPKWPRGLYFESKIELAGNFASLATKLLTNEPYGDLKILGADLVQYSQIQYDFRYFLPVNSRFTFAFRTAGGIGLAYGNSSIMPYSKQFYLGGSNSMRPYVARTIGPGTYLETDFTAVNQVGDLKFESNLEFRFKLSPHLSGALWSDYGNIWLLNEDPSRPNSGIVWNRFFKDSYLTGGIGLRLDLNFLLLRMDVGTVLYLPIFPEGSKWILQNKLFSVHPTFGFGFPF